MPYELLNELSKSLTHHEFTHIKVIPDTRPFNYRSQYGSFSSYDVVTKYQNRFGEPIAFNVTFNYNQDIQPHQFEINIDLLHALDLNTSTIQQLSDQQWQKLIDQIVPGFVMTAPVLNCVTYSLDHFPTSKDLQSAVDATYQLIINMLGVAQVLTLPKSTADIK